MEARTTIPLDALLEHTDWVRRLARRLVSDAAQADDVVQETLRAALESPPGTGTPPRAWLAVVARNAARALGRGESRRRHHESRAARPEAHAGGLDFLERAQLQQRVTEAVLGLPEPYRTTLLLRYFEECSAAEIARRLERPVDTVRTHLQRGHARLREVLDGEFGDRRSWCLALLPLVRDPLGAGSMTSSLVLTGGMVMVLKWSLAVSAVVLGWFGWAEWSGQRTDGADLERAEAVAASGGALAQVEPSPLGGAVEEVAAVRAPGGPSAPASTALAPAATVRVAGLLLDAEGAPLGGVPLRLVDASAPSLVDGHLRAANWTLELSEELLEVYARSPEAVEAHFPEHVDLEAVRRLLTGGEAPHVLVTSDASGRFEAELDFPEYDLEVVDPRWTAVSAGRLVREGGAPFHLLAPTASVAGEVLAADDAPAEGARVELLANLDALEGFPHVAEWANPYVSWQVGLTDARGRFAAEGLPVLANLTIHASGAEGIEPRLSLSEIDRQRVVLRFRQREERAPYLIDGVVLDQGGLPVAGAQVQFGYDETSTEADGRFAFSIEYLDDDAVLWGAQVGRGPARIDGLCERLAEDREAGRHLVLRLGPPTRLIRGRVVDGRGEPCPGARVYLDGGTPYGNVFANLEDVLDGRGNAGVVADEEGRFEYGGLFAERYTLRACLPGSFHTGALHDVEPGGEPVRLVVRRDEVLDVLDGRVVDLAGEPVAEARLSLVFTSFEADGGTRTTTSLELGRTGADGAFRFEDVPHTSLELGVDGPGLERQAFALAPGSSSGLRLVVERRGRFRLVPERFAGCDVLHALDEAGEPLVMTVFRGGGRSMMRHVALDAEGGSPVLEVSQRARTLVLYRDGQEVERLPLTLEDAEVTLVR